MPRCPHCNYEQPVPEPDDAADIRQYAGYGDLQAEEARDALTRLLVLFDALVSHRGLSTPS